MVQPGRAARHEPDRVIHAARETAARAASKGGWGLLAVASSLRVAAAQPPGSAAEQASGGSRWPAAPRGAPAAQRLEWLGCSSSTGRLLCVAQNLDTEPSSSSSRGPLSWEATTSGSAPNSSAFLHTALPMCLCLRRGGGHTGITGHQDRPAAPAQHSQGLQKRQTAARPARLLPAAPCGCCCWACRDSHTWAPPALLDEVQIHAVLQAAPLGMLEEVVHKKLLGLLPLQGHEGEGRRGGVSAARAGRPGRAGRHPSRPPQLTRRRSVSGSGEEQ